jgi:hypothetical protein
MVKLSFQLAENYSAANTDESAESSTAPVQPERRARPIKAAIKETFFILFPFVIDYIDYSSLR